MIRASLRARREGAPVVLAVALGFALGVIYGLLRALRAGGCF